MNTRNKSSKLIMTKYLRRAIAAARIDGAQGQYNNWPVVTYWLTMAQLYAPNAYNGRVYNVIAQLRGWY